MLQVNFLRENKERVIEGLNKRNFKQLSLVDDAIAADDDRKKYQFELDQNLTEMNKISKEIGILMKDGKKDEAESAKAKTAEFLAKNFKAFNLTSADEMVFVEEKTSRKGKNVCFLFQGGFPLLARRAR